jgi:glycosyltransferase involved in cell wall biosynthesis
LRALIITACHPPDPGRDVHGIYRRLSLFVGALAQLSEELEILHFVPPGWSTVHAAPESLEASQSAYWGTPVKVRTVSLREPPREGWRYALATVSVVSRPRFSTFAGPEQLAALESCLDRRPDVVFVHRLTSMTALLQLRRQLPPLFFDLDDIEHRVKIRSALGQRSFAGKVANLLQVPALYWAERQGVQRSVRTFLCSEEDGRYLRRLGVKRGVTPIANAVTLPTDVGPPSQAATILFLGGYDYLPNAQAAERLITRIWPRVREKFPDARLLIAGASPELIPAFAAHPPGVEFMGFVQDLRSLYDQTRLICSPISIGGGTRVKLIEAAAWGRPIVSTSIGAEGLLLESGTEILIRDEDPLIAEACWRLLEDYPLCVSIGEAARRRAALIYEVEAVRRRITDSMRSGLQPSMLEIA